MKFLLRFSSLGRFVIKRIHSQPLLSLVMLFSLVVFQTLVTSIPLYTDAVYQRAFYEKTIRHSSGEAGLPYLYQFEYYGSSSAISDWEKLQDLDRFLMEDIKAVTQLPVQRSVRFFSTDFFEMHPGQDATSPSEASSYDRPELGLIKLSMVEGIADHISLVEGKSPSPDSPPGNPIEVLASQDMVNESGLQVGEILNLVAMTRGNKEGGQVFPVRITGIWKADNPDEPFWTLTQVCLQGVHISELAALATGKIEKCYFGLGFLHHSASGTFLICE